VPLPTGAFPPSADNTRSADTIENQAPATGTRIISFLGKQLRSPLTLNAYSTRNDMSPKKRFVSVVPPPNFETAPSPRFGWKPSDLTGFLARAEMRNNRRESVGRPCHATSPRNVVGAGWRAGTSMPLARSDYVDSTFANGTQLTRLGATQSHGGVNCCAIANGGVSSGRRQHAFSGYD
jgi:hypothetical protein